MNTSSSEQTGFDVELGESERLYLEVSRMLLRAQRELHDAIFALDGTPASLDRFASARAELDSAEAWALFVVKKVPRSEQARARLAVAT